MIDDNDLILVTRAMSGDVEAFDELIKENIREVRETVAQVLPEQELMNRVIEDVFSLAFRNLEHFTGDISFRKWVDSLAYREALAQATNQQYLAGQVRVEVEVLESKNAFSRTSSKPDSGSHDLQISDRERSESQRRKVNKLENLPDTQSLIYVLIEQEGHTPSELAKLLNADERQIERLWRAVQNEMAKIK